MSLRAFQRRFYFGEYDVQISGSFAGDQSTQSSNRRTKVLRIGGLVANHGQLALGQWMIDLNQSIHGISEYQNRQRPSRLETS
jgi:hypothetical protein